MDWSTWHWRSREKRGSLKRRPKKVPTREVQVDRSWEGGSASVPRAVGFLKVRRYSKAVGRRDSS
eukprot:4246520-Lingulodinium_polyedra.AAC.1